GVQPFGAPDTRRLELRIRSQHPPEPLGASCPPALQAVVAKLLARRPADRYGDARAIREDLERVVSGRTTQAEAEGWPADRTQEDEPPTARTRPQVEEGRTPGTLRVETPATAAAFSPTHVILRAAELPGTATPHRSGRRYVLAAFLVLAFFVVGYESMIASRAQRLQAEVPAVELEGIGGLWERYQALGSRNLVLTRVSLEQTLTRRTIILADRII